MPAETKNNVLMQASSIVECRKNLVFQDIPINSNVNIFTKISKYYVEIWDIYRATNFGDLR